MHGELARAFAMRAWLLRCHFQGWALAHSSFQAHFQQSPNENDFSTLQQMFQTSNYAPSNISASNAPQQQTQQQAPSDSLFGR